MPETDREPITPIKATPTKSRRVNTDWMIAVKANLNLSLFGKIAKDENKSDLSGANIFLSPFTIYVFSHKKP
jgi:hypothetical protein